jgi:hypothetical protein
MALHPGEQSSHHACDLTLGVELPNSSSVTLGAMKVTFADKPSKTPSSLLLEALRTIRPVPWASHSTLPRELEPYQLKSFELIEDLIEASPQVPYFAVVFKEPVFDRIEKLAAALAHFKGRVEWALYRGTHEVVEGCSPRHWILAPKLYRDLDLSGTHPGELNRTCLKRQPELFQVAEDDIPELAAFVQAFSDKLRLSKTYLKLEAPYRVH